MSNGDVTLIGKGLDPGIPGANINKILHITDIVNLGGIDHLSIFNCVRDLKGTKCRVYTIVETCWKNPQWFHKKLDIEAHLWKEHDIRTVLPRGLKVVEEEQVSKWKEKLQSTKGKEQSSVILMLISNTLELANPT